MHIVDRSRAAIKQLAASLLDIGYDLIIILVGCGVFGAALILVHDVVTDFMYLGEPHHTFAHLLSDLMLALIIMALLDQVIHLMRGHPFSLSPFISIGLISSIRGFLIAQIKLGLDEIAWIDGLIQLGAYAAMTIAMAAAFYFFSSRASQDSGNG